MTISHLAGQTQRARARITALFITGLLAAAGLSAAVPTPARALSVGISDNNAALFSQPDFQALNIRRARLITSWDVARRTSSTEFANTAAWLQAARDTGVEASVAFSVVHGSAYSRKHPPSVAKYRAAFGAFRQKFPWVKVYTPWNEANHITQPTARYPERAAQFYNSLRSLCNGCTIVAADVLDQTNTYRWLVRFKKKARNPHIWGLHNYSDSNKYRSVRRSYTGQMTKWVKGQIWATEAGGVVRFTTENGERVYNSSPSRAAKAMNHLFKLIRSPVTRYRYKRVYVYQWFADPSSRWDSALTDPHGKTRPAYDTLARYMRLGGIS